MGIGKYTVAPVGTTRVRIDAYGRTIEVDSDQVKMHEKKYACVKLIQSLENDNSATSKMKKEKAINYILRTNRRLRRTVTVLD